MHLCSVTVAPGCGWHVHVNSHALAMPLAMTYHLRQILPLLSMQSGKWEIVDCRMANLFSSLENTALYRPF